MSGVVVSQEAMSAMDRALAAVSLSAAQHAFDLPKRIARKTLRGLSGADRGPLVLPLTAARASDDPVMGFIRLRAMQEMLLRHADYSERSQYRAALICLRWRRRFERAAIRLVVDNTMERAA